MKYCFLIYVIVMLSACSTIKTNNSFKKNSSYKVVKVPIIYENDTTYINELRFYKISSAMKTMKLMYDNFGKWDKKLKGKYHYKINQIIWENKNLLENEKSFTIIADGKESNVEFYASVMVFDSTHTDCLKEDNPLRDLLIKYFVREMKKVNSELSSYELFK